jgi:hypothetical protein
LSVNICWHRILLDKSGEHPGNGQKLPSKWSSLDLESWKWRGYYQASAILIMAIPSLDTPSRPATEREQQ